MHAIVYCCRREGRPLDREVIQGDPVRGDLIVRARGHFHRIALLIAQDGETYMLPVLGKVRIIAVNERGLLLSGLEMHPPRGSKGDGPVFQQTWWCVLRGGHVGSPASIEEAGARKRGREGAEIGRTMSAHIRRR